MSQKKKELTLDSSPEDAMATLKTAAEHFGADLCHLVGRDNDDKLLHVSVYARGSYAARLLRWIERESKRQDALDKRERAAMP